MVLDNSITMCPYKKVTIDITLHYLSCIVSCYIVWLIESMYIMYYSKVTTVRVVRTCRLSQRTTDSDLSLDMLT